MEHIEEKQPPEVLTSDTDNRTIIRPEEAPPQKQRKFGWFRAYNTGLWNGPRRENTEEFRRQDDLHRFDAIASQVSLTQYQKARGRRLLDTISLGEFTSPGRPIDSVLFALCAAVANEDVDDGTRYWPSSDRNDADFERVEDTIGADWNTLISLIQKFRARLRE